MRTLESRGDSMNIQEMRKTRGYSQAELAKLSGINLRSLQDYEQGHKQITNAKGETLYRLSRVLGYSIEDILSGSGCMIEVEINGQTKMVERAMAYERSMKNRYEKQVHFPIVVSDERIDMSRIYPTQQKSVKKVIDELRQEKSLDKVILFGSSITMRCNKDSDLDFCVGLKNYTMDLKNRVSEKIQEACDWKADILWFDRICAQDRVYGDIRKGLVLI